MMGLCHLVSLSPRTTCLVPYLVPRTGTGRRYLQHDVVASYRLRPLTPWYENRISSFSPVGEKFFFSNDRDHDTVDEEINLVLTCRYIIFTRTSISNYSGDKGTSISVNLFPFSMSFCNEVKEGSRGQ